MNIDIKELPILTVDDTAIDTSNLENEEEIMQLINIAYEIADDLSPTGTRTPNDIDNIEQLKTQLEYELAQRKIEEEQDRLHSLAVQSWAEKQRENKKLLVKQDKLEKMKRLHDALKNPKVGDLLFKVMNNTLTREQAQKQAFAAINSNPGLKKQMMSLTWTGTETRGGKSRVFRRKNKKMTSKSRRNVRRTRHTRRHRKSSSRRSTRK